MFGAPPVSEPIEECDLLVCTDEVSVCLKGIILKHCHSFSIPITSWLLHCISSKPVETIVTILKLHNIGGCGLLHRSLLACWCLRKPSAALIGLIQMCSIIVVARAPLILHAWT